MRYCPKCARVGTELLSCHCSVTHVELTLTQLILDLIGAGVTVVFERDANVQALCVTFRSFNQAILEQVFVGDIELYEAQDKESYIVLSLFTRFRRFKSK